MTSRCEMFDFCDGECEECNEEEGNFSSEDDYFGEVVGVDDEEEIDEEFDIYEYTGGESWIEFTDHEDFE